MKKTARQEIVAIGSSDVSIPSPTPETARTFAALTGAGWHPREVIGSLCPDVPVERWEMVAAVWLRTTDVEQAVDAANGGRWHELSEEERIALALQQHRAQCARFLVTHRLDEATGSELAKLEMARGVLERFVAGTMDVQDPLLKAMQAILGKVAAGSLPAQVVGIELDPIEDVPS